LSLNPDSHRDNYLKFSESIAHKEDIKKLFDESEEIKTAHCPIHPSHWRMVATTIACY
jgi:hypothetical protein